MTTEKTQIGAGESSPAPDGSAGPWKFPVNRYDEPRLYPGSTRYEGYAALFALEVQALYDELTVRREMILCA